MKPDVRLYDVLPAVFRACLWALCADLRFADARSDVAHPHVSLRLYSFLSPSLSQRRHASVYRYRHAIKNYS
jgi:hypothetical protein